MNRRGTILLVGITAASAASWLVLSRRLALHALMPWWFWRPTTDPRPAAWLLGPALAIVLAGVVLARRAARRPAIALALLVVGAALLSHLFALMDGRGLGGMRDRLLQTGHAVFAEEAAGGRDIAAVATGYRDLLDRGELPTYPFATKPPGHLLFVMATARVARTLSPAGGDPLLAVAALASVLWPLLAALALVPLTFLARLVLGPEHSLAPAVLLATAPNFVLIPMHLDQCLLPLLFLTPVTLFAYGLGRADPRLLVASGASASLAAFFSFALAAVPVLLATCLILDCLRRRSTAGALRTAVLWLAGALAFQGLLFLLLGYDPVMSYRFAVSRHQAWKIAAWTPTATAYVGALDLVEFALWSGVPIAILALAAMVRSAWKEPGLPAATLLLFLLLAFAGRTVAETARLWLFLVPLLALFATQAVLAQVPRRPWVPIAWLAALQVLCTFSLKLWQDFY